MTFETQINDLALTVATQRNTDRAARIAVEGILADLDTTDKTNLVAAINEALAAAGAGGVMDLDGLTDVVVGAHTAGRILRANGTNFVDVDPLTYFDAAGAAAAAQAAAISASQPLSANLTDLASQASTAYGRAILNLANTAALMGLLTAATETASGIVELATTAETTTGTDTTRAVTPAGVKASIDALIAGAPGALDTLNEIATALADDDSAIAALTTTVGTKMAKSANLSDVANVATSRTNLDVYSKAELGDPNADFASTFLAALD